MKKLDKYDLQYMTPEEKKEYREKVKAEKLEQKEILRLLERELNQIEKQIDKTDNNAKAVANFYLNPNGTIRLERDEFTRTAIGDNSQLISKMQKLLKNTPLL